jgi:hypothetical protein
MRMAAGFDGGLKVERPQACGRVYAAIKADVIVLSGLLWLVV